MDKTHLISVVAPVFSEELVISEYITRTLDVLQDNYLNYELILIDDGSTDKTNEICKQLADQNMNVRVISLSRNYGREIAITAGLDVSIGDYVVVMDSDLQDPPSLIPSLVNKIEEGYDVVFAKRDERQGETWFKKVTSKAFYKLATKLTGLFIPSDVGDFRVMSRKVVNSINKLREHNRYLKMLYAYVGYKTTSISFRRNQRFAGKSKYNYFKLVEASLDAIISFSNKPLRYISILAFTISFLTFISTLVTIVSKLISSGHIASGWTSIMSVILLMFSLLFMFLGVLSEYISRILVETKNRPLYYIKEEYGSTKIEIPSIIESD